MKILRSSIAVEENSKQYETPKNLSHFPLIIQKYYKVGLNKDFLKLAKYQGTLRDGIQCGPIPCPDMFEDNGMMSLFALDQDGLDLGGKKGVDIWYDPNTKSIYRIKRGIFSSKIIKIGDSEFKSYLKNQIELELGEQSDNKIIELESLIIKKINNL